MWLMVSSFLAAYVTVLVAELVGDKTLYSLGALATRFKPAPILVGAAAAFMLKMAAAVFLGRLIAGLHPIVVSVFSAATFFSMALVFLFKVPSQVPAQPEPVPRFSRAALVSFTTVFLPEWGDPGQLATAALVGQGNTPIVVWTAATLAMVTKATLGATLGIGLRRVAPQNVMRIASVVLCTTLGVLASFRIEI
jgi:putative Ca2+/H+ antiporter (TMEM165/GDT1 family)